MSLFKKILKLAYDKPELRGSLLPLIERTATTQSLVKSLTRIKGVSEARVLSDNPTPYGEREIVVGLFFDPKMGAEMGRQMLSSRVSGQLTKALERHKEYTFLRSISPSPGLDPYGRHDVTWENDADKFKRYYGKNPSKIFLQGTPEQRKKAAKEVHVSLQELPPALQKALKQVGYRRKDIRVEERTRYSPSEGSAGFEGNQGYVMGVNLSTGQSKLEKGDWGGGGLGHKQVDFDRKNYPIPPNSAVIVGESGGRGSFARILINPQNFANILPSEEKLSDNEMKALAIIKTIKGGYRKKYFDDHKIGPYAKENPILQGLARKGLIKVNARGAAMITTKGKNAVSSYRLPYVEF